MRILLSIIFLAAVMSSLAIAQDQEGIEVLDIAICTSVENRQPAGTDSTFTADVGKLYCFTKLQGEADTAEISHVWFCNDKEVAKIPLVVKAKTWRTWSAKTILPEWTGDWRVEVQDAAGSVVSTISFKIK
ncbi:MAG: DUF2914 domain-containing protein [Bacteroidetes bacterium]|nr:DUF2914 domain-containing protein [Bacteroidota bacterium]